MNFSEFVKKVDNLSPKLQELLIEAYYIGRDETLQQLSQMCINNLSENKIDRGGLLIRANEHEQREYFEHEL